MNNGNPLKVYVASKTKHAHIWRSIREVLRKCGSRVMITSTWIDEAGAGESDDLADLSERCIRESHECDLLIAYINPEEDLKGVLYEIGAALAGGAAVVVVGDNDRLDTSAFSKHRLITRVASLDIAIREMFFIDKDKQQ